ATICGDYITPSQASLIQSEIGATCPAFDVNAACSGFIYALDTASAYLSSGKASKILVVAYDSLSKFVDWTDRNTCVLFGDGGGAVVLDKGDDLLGINLTSEGNAEILNIPCHNESPFGSETVTRQFLQMNGQEVFKFAVSRIVTEMKKLIQNCEVSADEIDYVLLHQANIRIINAARQRLGMPESKFMSNLARYGNTSAGSIPVLLDELNRNGTLRKGQILALIAFGGGLTTGACLLRWDPAK
ncbi:MAG: beta-ketoacyl-ACP synthase 3, partial [Saccharofermentanales bacterium]